MQLLISRIEAGLLLTPGARCSSGAAVKGKTTESCCVSALTSWSWALAPWILGPKEVESLARTQLHPDDLGYLSEMQIPGLWLSRLGVGVGLCHSSWCPGGTVRLAKQGLGDRECPRVSKWAELGGMWCVARLSSLVLCKKCCFYFWDMHIILVHLLFIDSWVQYFDSPLLLKSEKIIYFWLEIHLAECPCREVMNLCLSEKIFISSSFLKDFFFFLGIQF